MPCLSGTKVSAQTITAPCIADPLAGSITLPLAQWEADGGRYFRWLEEPLGGDGVDNLAYFNFNLGFEYGDAGMDRVAHNSFRCDYAIYLRGERGCTFENMASVFDKLVISDDSPNWEEALHVHEAFHFPEKTDPADPAKQVPGNPRAENPRPVTRAYDLYNPALVADNHETAVATCVQAALPSTDYTDGGKLDCDEYPFKSTFEGASQAGTNYSARAIPYSHNRSGGASLGNWYKSERILNTDPFYVWVRHNASGGGGGGGGGTIVDLAPQVSAGSDTSGNEGSPILLGGSASDLEGTPTATWSWSAGADVDPGSNCSFASASSPSTTMTCTDDGTYTITLTASDGVNAAVSDSATVHVRNVAPKVTLGDPDTAEGEAGLAPWSVYRVGTAVGGGIPFVDPGSNDTHTCRVTWDDGTSTTAPASNGVCLSSHSFSQPGMYTLDITVMDDDGASDKTTTMVVVYDPNGGFATTGAYLDSPAGALASNPSAVGRLRLGMNPMYKPGEEGPAPGGGNVSASLDGGEFTLESTSLEWLVAAPNGRVAVKGAGTVNGVAGYGFVAYGYDDPDSIRLVVWSLSDGPYPGAKTLYDNSRESHYDLDLAKPQPLSGGSVQVHE